MKPRTPITDPAFKYTPSSHTDVAATFRRIRREQAQAKAAEAERIKAEQQAKVQPIRRQR